jgi:hypothetical protein
MRRGGSKNADAKIDPPALASMFYLCSHNYPSRKIGESTEMERKLQHDVRLRAAARAIYDACYPGDEWAPVGFEEAERCRTIHYRQAVGAALEARTVLTAPVQPELFALG